MIECAWTSHESNSYWFLSYLNRRPSAGITQILSYLLPNITPSSKYLCIYIFASYNGKESYDRRQNGNLNSSLLCANCAFDGRA